MLPKTQQQEYEHRRHKREIEVRLIIDAIRDYLERQSGVSKEREIQIFEFGAGDGFQIPYLTKLGRLIASDIYTSDGVKQQKPLNFLECSITDGPFRDAQFDLIFANQVIPDLMDIPGSLREARRIGKPSCLYAFAVPTALWYLLSLPAQYYNKLRYGVPTYISDSRFKKFLRRVLPQGRARWNFVECYHHYKLKSWHQLFSQHGFSTISAKPLLVYGPSEWPIIQTSRARTDYCSSMLFLLKKT